jgi:hypothetical protein
MVWREVFGHRAQVSFSTEQQAMDGRRRNEEATPLHPNSLSRFSLQTTGLWVFLVAVDSKVS